MTELLHIYAEAQADSGGGRGCLHWLGPARPVADRSIFALITAWKAAVHGVARSGTRLSDFPFTFHFHALEKEMTTHSSVLAWRIPGMAKPGGLPSMGSHRVGHD